jgi:DNA polymerase-3 subunit epsilon
MRQIVLDTETTGLSPEDGHRIIEIGCVEMVSRKLTGNRFHSYLNPQRAIDQGAVDVHGLDNRFLADKPLFEQVAADFIRFVEGSELVIHNAPFDVGFINAELRRLTGSPRAIAEVCGVLDTLAMAKKKHPGQRNSLDALCKRYSVKNSHRELHGALLDAEILAEVYLAMTGGQSDLLLEPEKREETKLLGIPSITPQGSRPVGLTLAIVRCSESELQAHQTRLEAIDKSSGGRCLWPR